ncbi:lactonase family protein [Vibrio alfacsensis]|uniref:lactonase family protein n=1 Tax=Vibrio alfacsensis TaxID=1074311 RepID=UPI0040677169
MSVSDYLQFYVGTYTDAPSQSLGITRVGLNTQTGEITRLDDGLVLRNPSYLTLTQHGLYTFSEVDRKQGAALTFSNAEKEYIVPINGDYPCHVDCFNQLLAVANYGSGNVVVYSLDEQGKPLAPIADLFIQGNGPNEERQTSPHAHQVTFLKYSSQLAVVDLGSDHVHLYDYDINQQVFSLSQSIVMPAGSGPRHLVFNRHETVAYVACELSETLVKLVKGEGQWRLVNQTALLMDEVSQEAAAAIRLSCDEKFLYVSCRAKNTISIFDVSDEVPKRVALCESGGAFPRDFILSRDGLWMLVANQHSNTLVSFRRDPESGKAIPTGYECHIDAPVCLVEQG